MAIILIVILALATLILVVFPDKPYIQWPLVALLAVALLWVFKLLGGRDGDDE